MIMSASFSQKNAGWAGRILNTLGDADRYEVAVGFPAGKGLETPHYTSIRADGTTVAGPSIMDVAIWNNYGAEVRHPGGTPYFVRTDGLVQFVGLNSPGAANLPRTKPHNIRIPPRPFFDMAAQAIAALWKAAQEEYRRELVNGVASPVTIALEKVGMNAEGQIVYAIDATASPANARATVKRKGSSHPLVDTGAMKQAVTYLVRERAQ